MVLMSMDVYDRMVQTSRVDAAIRTAEAEFAETGELLDAREALAALKEKHFG